MKMRTMLLPLLVAALVSPRRPAAAAVKCQQQCGRVNITYPFGIGRGCYLETGDSEEPFNVTCSNSTADGAPWPNPIPKVAGFEVLGIDVPGGKMRVCSRVSSWCYDAASQSMVDKNIWFCKSTAFRVSDTENELTVVGCDVLGYIGSQEAGVENRYVVGCNSSCPRGARSLANGSSCDGTGGCCRTTIQKGIRSFSFGFGSNSDNRNDVASFSPCGYAVLVEKEKFNFRTTYVTTTELGDGPREQLPMMLDWVVGNQTCKEALKNKTAYACVDVNSECVNSTNGLGYLCICSRGYRGNPYVKNGCEYIDECKEMHRPCPPNTKCHNTKDGPKCLCPPGRRFKGDGACEIDYYYVAAIGTCVGVVVVAIVMSCTCTVQEKKRLAAIKMRYFRQHGGLLLFEEMKSRRGQGHSFMLFTKEQLEQATDNFHEQHVLGKGGNGTVYRGELKDGRIVAIKRCRVTDNDRQRREFGKEMLILSQVNHRNIVKLYGCCLEVEVPMLVYQFIPNGTLCELIHGGAGYEDRVPPSFAVRLKIAHEAAEALAYLHSMASPPIIHGDVKSPNILLDENYTAKVSDFGASVLAPTDEAHLVTLVQGTCGYLDPEYMQTCRLTDKSDVYSFGVVLVELLTRRKALVLAAPEEERSLVAYFLSATRDGRLDKMVDPGIKGEVIGEVLDMFATLAKHCLEMTGEKRPSMCEVAEELDRIRKLCWQGCLGHTTHSYLLVSDRYVDRCNSCNLAHGPRRIW